MKILQCPLCHGKLTWNVIKEKNNNVIDAEMVCDVCNNTYLINDGIAYFLNPKYADIRIWQKCDRNNYKKMSSDEESTILEKKVDDLTSEELLLRIAILEKRKADISKIIQLYEMYFCKQGMEKTLKIIFDLIDELVIKIKQDKPRIVLDFVSGRGLLATELAHNIKDSLLIFSDINPIILRKCRENINMAGKQKNINYFVFDMKKSPFVDGGIECVTTLLGMQNIPGSDDLLLEIYRISQKRYYAISSLCNEKKDRNYQYLQKNKMLDVWIMKKMIDKLIDIGFAVHKPLLSHSEIVQPPTKEIVESGYAVTKFPCETCRIVYSLDQFEKKEKK